MSVCSSVVDIDAQLAFGVWRAVVAECNLILLIVWAQRSDTLAIRSSSRRKINKTVFRNNTSLSELLGSRTALLWRSWPRRSLLILFCGVWAADRR